MTHQAQRMLPLAIPLYAPCALSGKIQKGNDCQKSPTSHLREQGNLGAI